MSFKVYIDTNVFLDSYLKRDNGFADKVFSFLEDKEIEIYLKIIHNNWSSLLEPFEINRTINNVIDLTDSEIKQLREANINTPFIINNKAYLGFGDGLSGLGTNFTHQNKAMKIKKYLTKMDEYCKLHKTKICNEIYKKTNIKLEKLTLDLFYEDDELRIIETKSNCLI